MWTEMFSDSVLALEKSGSLDQDVPITTSFVFGSDELYAWLDRNERVHMTRTEVTNDPSRISANPLMVSINSSLEVDLFEPGAAIRRGDRFHRVSDPLRRPLGIPGTVAAPVGTLTSESEPSCSYSSS
jgi:hypothetical protein